jgi:hypothetical protein
MRGRRKLQRSVILKLLIGTIQQCKQARVRLAKLRDKVQDFLPSCD